MRQVTCAIFLAAVLFLTACQNTMCQCKESSIAIPPGLLTAAFEKAQQISDKSGKAVVYWFIAEAQVRAGDMAGASKTLDKAREAAALISDISDRVKAHRKIAETQAKAGDVDEAIKTAALISYDRVTTMWNYCYIAEFRAEVGDMAGVRKILDKAKEMAADFSKNFDDIYFNDNSNSTKITTSN